MAGPGSEDFDIELKLLLVGDSGELRLRALQQAACSGAVSVAPKAESVPAS